MSSEDRSAIMGEILGISIENGQSPPPIPRHFPRFLIHNITPLPPDVRCVFVLLCRVRN
jgi:hypothetical protein